ncbi:MAG: hypothetical protein MPK62_15175, partial [Alphaproteobacteria bacterium]|nr:hypothetical protein [Alphaproteobacteria bacterium]
DVYKRQLLGVGFIETYLTTKYRQLEFKAKTLTKQLNILTLEKNRLKSKISQKFTVETLLMEPSLKSYTKALPNDIPIVKFMPKDVKGKQHLAQQ